MLGMKEQENYEKLTRQQTQHIIYTNQYLLINSKIKNHMKQ